MAKKRNRNRSAKKQQAPAKRKFPKRYLAAFGSTITVAIVVFLSFHFGLIKTSGNSTNGSEILVPAYIKPGSFTKISSSDLTGSGSVNVYFLSWKGCPIGAAESWIIYNFTRQYYSRNNYIVSVNHTSDPNDANPGTPGLLFSNLSFVYSGTDFNLRVAYVYGEYVNNTGVALISSGSKILNKTFPTSISKVMYEFETHVPLGSPISTPSAYEGGHLTTSIVVAGEKGTYLLEGYIFNPADLKGYSPTEVMSSLDSGNNTFASSIGSGTAYLESIVSLVN